MDSVARGTLINLATRVLGIALVLAITAVVARIGPAAQGAFALFTSAEGLLLALCSGFGILLARRVSHDGHWPHALVDATVVACVALGAAAALVLGAVARFGPPAYAPLWILACAAPLLLLAPNLGGLWLGAGRMAPMARLSLASPLLALVAIGAAAALGVVSLFVVLVAWVAAKAAVGAAAVVAARRGAGAEAPDFAAARRGTGAAAPGPGAVGRGAGAPAPDSAAGRRRAAVLAPDFAALRRESAFVATIGLTNLVGLLNYRVGLFVVERHLGIEATGVYSIAVVVAELLWFVSGSLTQAAYGRIGTPDPRRAAGTTVRVVHVSLAALLLAAPLLWLLARALVPSLLGAAYAASLAPLALLLPGVLWFGGASALSAYFTNHAGAPHVPARVAALSLLLNAALAAVLVPRLGSGGAAVAASLSYAAAVLVLSWLFSRHAGVPLRSVLLPGRQLREDLRAVALRARGR